MYANRGELSTETKKCSQYGLNVAPPLVIIYFLSDTCANRSLILRIGGSVVQQHSCSTLTLNLHCTFWCLACDFM